MRVAEAAPLSAAEADKLFADFAGLPSLLLAVSGGPDSTALLLLAARWRDRRKSKHKPKLLAVTVDHGLRPESKREAKAVKKLAAKLGVAHRTLSWCGKKPATGLQQAARPARYRLLVAAAKSAGVSHVFTAHTLDDQAETVLIRLLRGSGLTGLGAMARVSRLDTLMLVRPLLELPKTRLIATLRAAGIAFAEDPSNVDPRFTRARLRGLMPDLAREGLSAGRLSLLARRLRRADVALEAAVDEAAAELSLAAWSTRAVALQASGFSRLPAEIALRLLGRAIAQVGDEGPVELGKLEALVAAAEQKGAQSNVNARFRRTLAGAMVSIDRDRVVVERAPARRSRAISRHGKALTTRLRGTAKRSKER